MASSSDSPAALGAAFRRVHYCFHAELFARLGPPAAPLAAAFGDIWTCCERWATAADLAAHLTGPGISIDDLVARYGRWSPQQRAAFLGALSQTIAAEVAGDAARGRRRLAALLSATLPLLADLAVTPCDKL